MYMRNLVFDFDEVNPHGCFEEYIKDPKKALMIKSMNWLRLDTTKARIPEPTKAAIDSGAFVPEKYPWIDAGPVINIAQPSALPGASKPGVICIRIVPDPTHPIDPSATLKLAVCFGKAVAANHQKEASPFTDNGKATGKMLTSYFFDPAPRKSPKAGGPPNGSWVLALDELADYDAVMPSIPITASLRRYGFSVGAIVKSGGVELHFADDPEMETQP